MSSTDFRLPHTVLPRRYDLRLDPDLNAATFTGRVVIEVEITEPVDEIVLHALDLELTEVVLEPIDAGGVPALGASVNLDPQSETAVLVLDTTAGVGQYELHCRFSGALNDKLVGFYKSTFTDPSGDPRTIAVTQFEAPHARKAFPCFDEPEFKAVFAISLVVDDDLLAVSNGAEVSREPAGDGRVAVTFAATIPMSTYLVAFVIGPLEATDPIDVDGVPVRIVHPPGQSHLTQFALDTAAAALRYFTDYFDMAYPGDKLDLVAVPDFAFGAMENLGCVTFREVLVLVDPDSATQPELQRVADVINHELAHMWFGDLVTMRWWNGIWLNEAFATFMEMRATDDQKPEWKRWVDFGLSRTAAFDVDALQATRPIEFEVKSPADAEGMFDLLTYEKGAAVVRMLEQYIGDDPFRSGIRAYMTKHRLSNTETTDLWDAIEASTDTAAREIMDSWIYQPGFPLVSAARQGTELTLSQAQFNYGADADGRAGEPAGTEAVDATANTTAAPSGETAARWQVPVHYRSGGPSGTEAGKVLLKAGPAVVTLPADTDWVVVNADGAGFFRVLYREELGSDLAPRATEVLEPIERYGLVDDHWAAVLGGQATATSFVELAERLADTGESDLSVWQRIIGALDTLVRVADAASRPAAVERARGILEPAHRATVAVADPDDRTRQLTASLFGGLARITGDPALVATARELHRSYIDDPVAVDPGLLGAALRVLAAHGSERDFERIVQGFRTSPTPQVELRHLNAMADVTDGALMERLLDMTLDEVRTQNAPYVLAQALANESQADRTWQFVEANWETMLDRFPTNSIVRLLGGIRSFTSADLASQAREFLADHEVPSGTRTLTQHLERMGVNVALAQREATALA